MTAKYRLTLVLCVNATGSCKVPPVLIGTSANPDFFRNGRSPIPYTNQENAGMDKQKYRQWWSERFLSVVRAHARNGEKVTLLLDNSSGNDHLAKIQTNVFLSTENLHTQTSEDRHSSSWGNHPYGSWGSRYTHTNWGAYP